MRKTCRKIPKWLKRKSHYYQYLVWKEAAVIYEEYGDRWRENKKFHQRIKQTYVMLNQMLLRGIINEEPQIDYDFYSASNKVLSKIPTFYSWLEKDEELKGINIKEVVGVLLNLKIIKCNVENMKLELA
jgi:hypothetical protein